MSRLLRCPGASALGWDAPPPEDDNNDEREESKAESNGESKEVKGETHRESQLLGVSTKTDGGHATMSLGSKKRRRMNEQNESPQGEDKRTTIDRNDANEDTGSPTDTAKREEGSEAVIGKSIADSDEDSATKDTERAAMETSDNNATALADEDGSDVVTFNPLGSEIVITGTATITVLEGKVEILGCTIDCMDESTSVQIYSPDGGWASALTIVDVSSGDANSDEFESMSVSARPTRIRVDSLSWDDFETGTATTTFRITQRSEVRSAFIIADRWRTTADVVMSDLTRPMPIDAIGEKDENELPDSSRVLICGAKGVGKSTYVRYLLNKVMSCGQTSNNSARKKPRRVAVLDCDVGQPELGPPGLITLTVLEKPLLSPPHAHMVCAGGEEDDDIDGGHPCFSPSSGHASARFFGHISAKADPSSYTAAIAGLVREYEKLVKKEVERSSAEVGEDEQLSRLDALPLVVNTAGWVKGMGFEILSSIVDVVKPGHIVQIVGAARAKFFDLTPHAFEGRSIHVVEAFGSVSRLPTDQDATPPPSRAMSPVPPTAEANKQSDVSTDTLQSTGVNNTAASSASTGSLRALRISSYFLGGYKHLLASGANFWPASGGIYDPHCSVASTLAAMRPYCVPFHSVFCFVPSLVEYRGTLQADELILKSLNGSIVGLCHWKGATHKEDTRNQHESVVQTTPPHVNAYLLPCMGLGVVRGIDRVKQCFYILTPIAQNRLMKSPPNVLVRGLLQLPLTCTHRGVHSETLPHQNCDGISSGTGDDIMKSKNAPAKPAGR